MVRLHGDDLPAIFVSLTRSSLGAVPSVSSKGLAEPIASGPAMLVTLNHGLLGIPGRFDPVCCDG